MSYELSSLSEQDTTHVRGGCKKNPTPTNKQKPPNLNRNHVIAIMKIGVNFTLLQLSHITLSFII